MAVFFTVFQNTRKGGNKLWYARAVHPGSIDLDTIAERIQRNCSMKKSDCLAVMTEMVEVMNDALQNSEKVRIEGLGTFYIGLRSGGAIDEKEFNANEYIKGCRVGFLAEGKRTKNGVTRAFTSGITYKKTSGFGKTTETPTT